MLTLPEALTEAMRTVVEQAEALRPRCQVIHDEGLEDLERNEMILSGQWGRLGHLWHKKVFYTVC